MSQEVVERVLGRLITDTNFRRLAAESLEMACRQTGYLLTPTELRLLSRFKLSRIAELEAELDPGLCHAVSTF